MRPPRHGSEEKRLATLHGYEVLDTGPEEEFEEICELASSICGTPVALVSLVDSGRQWFKARRGIDSTETNVDQSICAHAILGSDLLEIGDLREDPRTRDNPLVTGEADVFRFYAGAVLVAPDGLPLGTVCVLDRVPRSLDEGQRNALRLLARLAMKQLELGRSLADARTLSKEIDHRVKNSLASVASLLSIQRRRVESSEAEGALQTAERRVRGAAELHRELYLTDDGAEVDLSAYLGRVGALLNAWRPETVELSISIDPGRAASPVAASVGTVVSELVANSYKHAFPDGRVGRVGIEGRMRGGDYIVSVQDDGAGPASAFVPGLGLSIADAAAGQAGGALRQIAGGGGLRTELRLPAGIVSTDPFTRPAGAP